LGRPCVGELTGAGSELHALLSTDDARSLAQRLREMADAAGNR
jgi:hypothetical protein